jgi:hypothetical protein
MFFRREHKKTITFDQRMEDLRKRGFTVTPAAEGRVTVSRGGVAVALEKGPDEAPKVAERAGILMPGGIGKLVDGGYQKFFLAPGGQKKPAQASELKAVHEFQEDLREALGLVSLYNESLGTVSTEYLYDRVQDRDRGVPKRPWQN